MSDRVAAHLAGQKDAILDRLLTLIRFPSVSTDPAFEDGMRGRVDFTHDITRGTFHRTEVGLWVPPPTNVTQEELPF